VNIYLSALVAAVGLGFYLYAGPPPGRAGEVGRISFFAGLLAFLLQFGGTANLH
jgi:hypothetical protein